MTITPTAALKLTEDEVALFRKALGIALVHNKECVDAINDYQPGGISERVSCEYEGYEADIRAALDVLDATRATEPALDTERGLPLTLPNPSIEFGGVHYFNAAQMYAYARAALDKAGDGEHKPEWNEAEFNYMVARGTETWSKVPHNFLERERGNAPQASADDAREAARWRYVRPTMLQSGLTDEEIDAAIAIAALQRKEG